jgi:hypothetical protein
MSAPSTGLPDAMIQAGEPLVMVPAVDAHTRGSYQSSPSVDETGSGPPDPGASPRPAPALDAEGSEGSDPFYTASGSSPPGERLIVQDRPSTMPEPLELPPQLVEDLARLFAAAIIADMRRYPNLTELKANREATVESPSRLNRKRSARALADGLGAAQQATPRLAKAG